MKHSFTELATIRSDRVNLLKSLSLTEARVFLEQIVVYDFRSGLMTSNQHPIDACAERSLVDGLAHITCSEERVQLSVPVFRGSELRSMVTFIGTAQSGVTGVFEIWEPQGVYKDLKLSESYYGKLERFQNVSSYIRFEMGAGLPGQAALQGQAIIHDDLQNHPGFLRAAGASAVELQTAIALPIFKPDLVAAVLLISSRVTPLSRWIEVWQPRGAELELSHIAQTDLDADLDGLPQVGQRLPKDTGILGEVVRQQAAILSSDSSLLSIGRSFLKPVAEQSCLAIPTFQGAILKSICLLWL